MTLDPEILTTGAFDSRPLQSEEGCHEGGTFEKDHCVLRYRR